MGRSGKSISHLFIGKSADCICRINSMVQNQEVSEFTLGGSMAATRLIALHINKGRTLAKCLADRIGYSKSIDKTDEGRLVSSYACNSWTYCVS